MIFDQFPTENMFASSNLFPANTIETKEMADTFDKLNTGEAVPRKYLAHYINATPGEDTATWVRLGEDLEEFKDEFSATVDKKKNILGKEKIKITDYEVTGSVDPYYAYVGDALYDWLESIARNRLTLDKCKTQVLTVYCWKTSGETTGTYAADQEDVVVEVKSMGGDVNGVSIPFDIHHTGEITTGTFATATKTFTAAK